MMDARTLGATGDGLKDDTRALQAALHRAAEAGCPLRLPAGRYSTGSLVLPSHTTLRVEEGAALCGRPDLTLFPGYEPVRDSRLGRLPWRAFLYAQDAHHITLEGPGQVLPNGEAEVFQNGKGDSPERPFGLHFVRCRQVKVSNLVLHGSAFWMQRYFCCEEVELAGLRVYNHCNLNNDGLDIDGCRRVSIHDCEIDSSDDALVIKSESEQPSEEVRVARCVLRTHASALKLGTGSVGGYRRITFEDCQVLPSRAPRVHHPFKVRGGLAGLDLGCVDRGVMEDVVVQNITLNGVQSPLFIRLGDRGAPPWVREPRPGGCVRGLLIRHIQAVNAGPIASSITGYPGFPVQQVRLEDIRIEATRSAFVGNVDKLPLPRWSAGPLIHGSADPRDRDTMLDLNVPENVNEYPVNRMFGCPLPAYGLYARHVAGLAIHGLHLRMSAPDDPRPAVVLDDVAGADLRDLDLASHGPQTLIHRPVG